MLRKITLSGMSTCILFGFAAPVLAQNINEPLPFPITPPNQLKKLEKLQQNFQRLQQRQIDGMDLFGGQPGMGRRAGGGLKWGGAKLEKANGDLQAQLGLNEKEGLVVTGFDPNSEAQKAGLKAKDVIIKIGDQTVPSDADSFAKLVKDQKGDVPLDLVVVRDGKEQTIKSVKMPDLVQNNPERGGFGGIQGLPAFGGRGGLNGIAIGIGRLNQALPLNGGAVQDFHLDMTVNGARTIRDQKGEKFSGQYSKDNLKITVSGKIENGQARATEITVTEGKETKKYTNLADVPLQHRFDVDRLLPSAINNLMPLPMLPFPDFQDLIPLIPELRD